MIAFSLAAFGGAFRSMSNNERTIVVAPQTDIRPCDPNQAGEVALAEYYELAVASAKIDRPHEPAADYARVIGRLCKASRRA
jgi:hypothetical protein